MPFIFDYGDFILFCIPTELALLHRNIVVGDGTFKKKGLNYTVGFKYNGIYTVIYVRLSILPL